MATRTSCAGVHLQLPVGGREGTADLANKFPGNELGDALRPVPVPLPGGGTGTDLYIGDEEFRRVFAADVRAEVDYQPGYPVTVNFPDEARFALRVAADLFNARTFELPQPVTASEDFSRVLQRVHGRRC